MRRKTKKHILILHNSYFVLQGGMTLVELLVVTAIITILSGTLLFNYRTAQDELALQRSAYKLAQDTRRAKSMAISAEEFPPGSGDVPETGFGIVFGTTEANKRKYILYADGGGNEFFQGEPPDLIVETVYLEEGVYVEEIRIDSSQKSSVCINFKPPDPEVRIKHLSDDNNGEVTIKLALEADSTKTKTIRVNKLGLVTIE